MAHVNHFGYLEKTFWPQAKITISFLSFVNVKGSLCNYRVIIFLFLFCFANLWKNIRMLLMQHAFSMHPEEQGRDIKYTWKVHGSVLYCSWLCWHISLMVFKLKNNHRLLSTLVDLHNGSLIRRVFAEVLPNNLDKHMHCFYSALPWRSLTA